MWIAIRWIVLFALRSGGQTCFIFLSAGLFVLCMEKVPASRMEFDPCGHYARPDVLHLEVRE